MGDGVTNRHVIIINGDNGCMHNQRASEALDFFREKNFEISLLNPVPLDNTGIHYYARATEANLKNLLDGFSSDDDDEIFIYITGHGAIDLIILEDTMFPSRSFNELLPEEKYGKRTVLYDGCSAFDSVETFENPKTLFISLDWWGRSVICGGFSPFFFESDEKIAEAGADKNADGLISMQERYAYATRKYKDMVRVAISTYFPGSNYKDTGFESNPDKIKPPKEKIEVSTQKELESALSRLEPGQFALLEPESGVHSIDRAIRNVATIEIRSGNRGPLLFDHMGRCTEINEGESYEKVLIRLLLSYQTSARWAQERILRKNDQALGLLGNIISFYPDFFKKTPLPFLLDETQKGNSAAAWALSFAYYNCTNRTCTEWFSKNKAINYETAEHAVYLGLEFFPRIHLGVGASISNGFTSSISSELGLSWFLHHLGKRFFLGTEIDLGYTAPPFGNAFNADTFLELTHKGALSSIGFKAGAGCNKDFNVDNFMLAYGLEYAQTIAGLLMLGGGVKLYHKFSDMNDLTIFPELTLTYSFW